MKTKNIFRMLLVAAALLLGANSVKADEVIVLWDNNNVEKVMSFEDPIPLEQNDLERISDGDELRFYGKVTNESDGNRVLGLYTANNNQIIGTFYEWLKDPFIGGVASYTFTKDHVSKLISYNSEGTPLLAVAKGINMTITKIEVLHKSSGGDEETPITYSVTINAGSNGSASANLTSTTAGQIVTITTDPDNGYEVDAVTVANVNVTKVSENTYTFPMPGNDVTVNVTFKAKSQQQATTYSITINSMQNGTVTASKTSSIAANEEITLTITPDNGYQLGSIAVKDANNTNVNLSGTGNTRTFSMPASNVIVSATFTMQSTGDVTAYIGSTGKATFSYNEPLNFAGVTGMKAYIATTVSGNQVTLTQVTGTVAAGTGLVIISDNGGSGSFDIPSVATGDSYTNNLLVAGNDQRLTLSNSYTDYVLIADTEGLAVFAEVWSSDHLPIIESGKAYLHVPTSANARTRSLSIVISNGTTGISSVEKEQGENLIYNLRGQRVENPTKGLYIINGKKVLIK